MPSNVSSLPCACNELRKATRTVTRLYDEALKPAGLRVTQYALLSSLRADTGTPVSRLAEQLEMDRTTLSRNLVPLERRGLVAIEAGPDARSRLVSITPAGIERVTCARPYWRAAQASIVERLGADETKDLLARLAAVGAMAETAGAG